MPSMSNAMDSKKKRRKLNTINENHSILGNRILGNRILGKRKIGKESNITTKLRVTNIIKRLRTITEAGKISSHLEVLEHTVETINRKDLLIRGLIWRNKNLLLIIGKGQEKIKLEIDLRYDNEMQRLEEKNQKLSTKISSLFGTINNLKRKLAE